jgi:uncharacterized protein
VLPCSPHPYKVAEVRDDEQVVPVVYSATESNADASAVVRAYCDAWMARDTTTILSLYHRDLNLHWPGRHHLAGVHEGQAASINALLALQTITNRLPIEIVDIMPGRNSVMVIVNERWSNTEVEPIELTRALDFTVLEGQLRTCRIFESDQAAVDDWIARNHNTIAVE